ncbi:hypothetical protein P8825_15290 [Shouchella clausii]|uniref:hypothetical protein n=1 Tax=Shouchella clausii TaxID=79880 RepID=UPI002DBC0EB8|nr:hypothetical protein [Shouchella clausii]MEB5480929.1 hypothetical protein [Shouchella clausii]
MKQKLYDEVLKFMLDNEITCEETIHQCDHVIISALDFIETLFHIVKADLPNGEIED